MELFEAINKRKSVRKFKKDDVPDKDITAILEAAILAPSAGNLQTWKFIVIKNQEIKESLKKAAWNQGYVAQAPVVIAVCCDMARTAGYGNRGCDLYTLHDTGAAIQNILLSATALGLATVWVGAFDEEGAAKILNLDYSTYRPVALIPLGYGAEEPKAKPRRPLSEVVSYI